MPNYSPCNIINMRIRNEGRRVEVEEFPSDQDQTFVTTWLMFGKVDPSQDYLLRYLDKWIKHI